MLKRVYQAICLFLYCTLLWACYQVDLCEEDELDVIKKSLVSYQNNGFTIDSVDKCDSVFVFSFSNEAMISLSEEMVHIINICDDSNNSCGTTVIANEEYEDWVFCFDDTLSIRIRKSLFALNPDSVLRGINHRGYSGEAPENTLPAFRLSKLKGFMYVETDVHFTSDDVPVLIHNATIELTSNGTGEVKSLTWEEIRQYDFGQWKSAAYVGTKIPSLEEFLALCRDIKLYPYIELKAGSREQLENVVDLVEKYELKGKAIYISFSEPILRYIINKEPTATVGYLAGSPLTESAITKAQGLKTGRNDVFIDASDYSESAVTLCRKNSIPLEVWTIDSESTIRSLSPYITGVTSNKWHAGRLMMESRR